MWKVHKGCKREDTGMGKWFLAQKVEYIPPVCCGFLVYWFVVIQREMSDRYVLDVKGKASLLSLLEWKKRLSLKRTYQETSHAGPGM